MARHAVPAQYATVGVADTELHYRRPLSTLAGLAAGFALQVVQEGGYGGLHSVVSMWPESTSS